MSKEEFIKGYCERSEISREEYDKNFLALKCNCEDTKCNGWATVSNDSLSIKAHNDLYSK